MKEVIITEKNDLMGNWKNEVMNLSHIQPLQKRIDEAARNGQAHFHDFNDFEMVTWFLHRRKHLKAKNERSVRTVKEYERELRLFVKQLLSHAVEIDLDIEHVIEGSLFKSLSSRHLRKYHDWLETYSYYAGENGRKTYSAATLSRKTTILKSFFSFLYEAKYIKEPIHLGFRIASVTSDDRPNRDMGADEVLELLYAFQEDKHDIMFAIVHVLATTGLRNEEFCKLQVSSVKADRINGGHYLKVSGKGNKERELPIKPKVLQSIQLFRKARGLSPIESSEPSEHLFTTNTGKPYSPSYFSQYVKKEIEQIVGGKETDLTITPHVFRHAFTIISLKNGADLYQVMRSLGHTKLETTQIYVEKVFARESNAIHSWKPEQFGEFI